MNTAWPIVPLAELADVFNGKTPTKAEQRESGHPVLKIRDVSEEGVFRGRFESFVEPELVLKYAGKRVTQGDTLILNAAHNAAYVASKIYRAEPPVFGSLATGEWLIVRPSPERLHPSFAYQWLRSASARRTLRELVKGIHLYPKDVARIGIPLPPLAEQHRISEILDRADTLHSKRSQALATLDALKRAAFIALFGDAPTWGRWPARSFDEIASDETSRSGKRPQSGFSVTGRYPIVDQGQNAIAGYCDDEALVCVSQLPVIVFGDHTRNVKLVEEPFVVGADGAKVLVPRPDVDATFLSWALRLAPIPDLGYSRHMREVKRLSFPYPPLELQREFTRRIRQVERVAVKQRESIALIHELFVAAQERAFMGQL